MREFLAQQALFFSGVWFLAESESMGNLTEWYACERRCHRSVNPQIPLITHAYGLPKCLCVSISTRTICSCHAEMQTLYCRWVKRYGCSVLEYEKFAPQLGFPLARFLQPPTTTEMRRVSVFCPSDRPVVRQRGARFSIRI